MNDSPSNPADPASALPTLVSVICDQCRATGMAGDAAFSAIPDILAFDPVTRRAHVNNWTAEHQRAFIAALAITGSPRQAARILGRHMFGAQQLRTARGGKSFSDAWDAALDVARDREFARIHANLSALSAERTASDALAPGSGILRSTNPFDNDPADSEDSDRRDYLESRLRIRERLTRARRLLLAIVSEDPAKRAAWEVLVGPVDWDRASRHESQADEPFDDPESEGYDINPHNFTKPVLLLTAEAGLLPDILGGPDALAPLRAIVAARDAGEEEPEEQEEGEEENQ